MKRMPLYFLILALLLSACQPVPAPATGSEGRESTSKEGGWIMVANIEDPASLDPHKTIMATASSIQAWIYDSLFYIGEDGLSHGQLAES